MKNILFIETNTTGTGSQAMRLAKGMGLQVHFWTTSLDQYKSMEEDHPQKLADEIKIIDTYDSKKMVETILKENIDYCGVLAFDDYHLIPVAKIAFELKLPGHTIESLESIRNKRKMREFVFKANIISVKQPEFFPVSEETDIQNYKIKYPCVFKPVDDSGSNGVTICSDLNSLKNALKKEKKRSVNERGYELKKEYLIEEFIDAQEYSAEMIYQNEEWHLISITEKETFGTHAIEVGHTTERNDNFIKKYNIESKLKTLLNLFQLNFGAAHVEFFLKGEELYLVEINPRLGGDCIPELVYLSTGVDMIKHVLYSSVDKIANLNFTKNNTATIRFLLPQSSVIYKDVKINNSLQMLDSFKRLNISKLPIQFNEIKSSYNRLGYGIFSNSSKEKLKEDCSKFEKNLVWDV